MSKLNKMRKRVFILISVLLILAALSPAQEPITINRCYESALEVHPLSRQKQIQQELWQINDKNMASGWYPTMDAGASILYNTNVTDMSVLLESLPIPGGIPGDIGGMPKDQYKLTIDVNQLIWDGGSIKNARLLEEKSNMARQQEIDVELYKTREYINNTFFGIALQKQQIELLRTYLELVKERINTAESGINSGFTLESEKSKIIAERIKLEQEINAGNINLNSLCALLSDLTGMEINHDSDIIMPDISPQMDPEITRPEIEAMNMKIETLTASEGILEARRLPKAFGFATVGYGSPPGNDFFSDSFGTFAVIGAGIKWNIFDWNTTKREIRKIDLNKSLVNSGKENMEDAFNRMLINKYAEIQGLETMLESDRELIKLRESITLSTESQFRNGTINATEYMSSLNREKEARLSQAMHKISLAKARVEYLNISGNEIK